MIFKLEQKSKIRVTKNFVSVSIAVPQYSKAYGLGNFDQLEKTFDDSIFSVSQIFKKFHNFSALIWITFSFFL